MSESGNFHNLENYSSFIQSKDPTKDGKKYKLRLKFDGASLVEVIRLNGGHFQNLTHLDISGNSAEKLDLRNLSRLEWLCCANNQLEILILSGTSLTFLDCSHNKLESIVVDPLPNNLITLQLSFNNLSELPSWTWMIPELLSLQAAHNRLQNVDCKFKTALTHLPISELDLHANSIESVSKDFIQRAQRLNILNLSQNRLKALPPFGKRCPVQEIYLSRNLLEDRGEFEALEFLQEASRVKRLHLSFNKIQKVNEKFTSIWKNLEELILCGNRIETLPVKMQLLTKLRVLRIHANRLKSVPNLAKMSQLKLLDLSHNNLKKINLETLISGGNLTYLDISCNEKLTLCPERLFSPRRVMNLVEVTNPKRPKPIDVKNNKGCDFAPNPPWDLGFSELPDRKQCLTIMQYRDVDVNNGKEALFGIFDAGPRSTIPKSISKSIAKLYAEERNIEESLKLSLKYTLLNTLRNLCQNNHVTHPSHGVLAHLCMQPRTSDVAKPAFTLNVATVGNILCLLVGPGKKVTPLTSTPPPVPKKPIRSTFPLIDFDQNERSQKCKNESDTDSTGAKSSNIKNSDIAIPDPTVFSVELTPSHEFLLLASRSVWNHVTQDDIVDELETHRNKKCVLIAKRITDLAQSHVCKQSLSVILVQFKWRSASSRGLIVDPKTDYGPLCYSSASSNCSDDIHNPLTSMTTPDSAIDTDRSSGGESVGTDQKRLKTSGSEPDTVSMANTTMSVEQFRCWEYMLEQNTRLIFKKELDTISKGFMRNQQLRKSVQFPYAQEPPVEKTPPPAKSEAAGFYSLSKAKSFVELAHGEPVKVQRSKAKSHFPLFTNANAGFLESVRATSERLISGGDHAAYFGSAQRLGTPQHHNGTNCCNNEITEIQCNDPAEKERRLKKYWDNKVTYL